MPGPSWAGWPRCLNPGCSGSPRQGFWPAEFSRRPIDSSPEADGGATPGIRFSAKSLASQRRRLGLSAAECGLLVGTSAQSIYNWEAGKVRPRARHLVAIAALRTLGKKDAAAHLAARR